MSPTDWAILIPVLLTAATAASAGTRKVVSWIFQYGYERAKAEDWKEHSKAAIDSKNLELQLEKEENERLREQNELKDRTIERLTGGTPS